MKPIIRNNTILLQHEIFRTFVTQFLKNLNKIKNLKIIITLMQKNIDALIKL